MNANKTRTLIILSILLSAVTLSIFWQVGDFDFINYDDNDYVYDNIHIADGLTTPNIIWALTSFDASNWNPISRLSHMADVQMYGMDPRGHHLTSLFLHIVSTILLLLFLFRTTHSPWQSAFVAALFALHPLHVESVAWVADRKDIVSTLFCFLTLLLYTSYVTKRKPVLYFSSLALFALALMAKPTLVILPVLMLLIDYWPLNRSGLNNHKTGPHLRDSATSLLALFKEKIPFFACSLLFTVITMYAQGKGNSLAKLDQLPIPLRVENAVIAYMQYCFKTLWPHDLAVFYPFPSSIPLWWAVLSFIFLLIVSTITIWAARRIPYLAVGWFWFIITLVPVIGLVQVGSAAMADRFSYFPIIGLFIMAAWGVPALVKELPLHRSILVLLAGAVIITSSVLSWKQLGYWRNDESLFRHALQVTSNNYLAHNNVGVNLGKKGETDAAIKEFQEAIRIKPDYFTAHENLGLTFAMKKDFDAAIKEYQEAIQLNANDSEPHNNLGVALASKGDIQAAIKEFREALTINPQSLLAQRNLAALLSNIDSDKSEFNTE